MITFSADAVVTKHQSLEIPICILHGDTRKVAFPSDVKATVQYGVNLQALSVALNTVDAVCCAPLIRELTEIDKNHPKQKWASAFIDLYWKRKRSKIKL